MMRRTATPTSVAGSPQRREVGLGAPEPRGGTASTTSPLAGSLGPTRPRRALVSPACAVDARRLDDPAPTRAADRAQRPRAAVHAIDVGGDGSNFDGSRRVVARGDGE